MNIKYVVKWSKVIASHECTKETAKTVWLKGTYFDSDEVFKKVKGNDVFDTWEEAHAELLRRAESELQRARNAVEWADLKVRNVKGMKPPVVGVEG